jgi:hypothetical protein
LTKITWSSRFGVSAASQPPAHLKKKFAKKPNGNTLDRLLLRLFGLSIIDLAVSLCCRLVKMSIVEDRIYSIVCSGFVVVVSYEVVL